MNSTISKRMFVTAGSVASKDWQQPRCYSTEDKLNKLPIDLPWNIL